MLEHAWLLIDGSSIPCYKPSNGLLHQLMWVPYKHHCALRFTLVCTPQPKAVLLTDLDIGSLDDKTIVKSAKLIERLEQQYSEEQWRSFHLPAKSRSERSPAECTLMLAADKGYFSCNSGKHVRFCITDSGQKEAKMQGLQPGDVMFSSRIAPLRSAVERFFRPHAAAAWSASTLSLQYCIDRCCHAEPLSACRSGSH